MQLFTCKNQKSWQKDAEPRQRLYKGKMAIFHLNVILWDKQKTKETKCKIYNSITISTTLYDN